MRAIEYSDIEKAQENLKGIALETLCEYSRSASEYIGKDCFLKFENQQKTGSFKIRGAYNKISSLTPEQLKEGISACSAGNHAQGVAYSSTLLGAESHIVMPLTAPIAKIQATKSYGAQIHQYGHIVDEAYEHCMEITKEKGYHFVHPYNDPLVVAGQGTLGMELYKQISNLDSVVISIGGGGLISGTALALKTLNPKIKVYGAVAEASPGMFQKFYKKEASEYRSRPTIADGIAIKTPSSYIFDHYISKYVDGMVTVSDEEVAQSMVYLLERAKALVEGAGAAGLAAAKKADWDLGKKTAIVLCGGNVDLSLISRIIEKGMSVDGRMTRVKVLVEDLPGNLNLLTRTLSDLNANIIDVKHDRISSYLGLRETMIEFLLMTKSQEHVDQIKASFVKKGARLMEN